MRYRRGLLIAVAVLAVALWAPASNGDSDPRFIKSNHPTKKMIDRDFSSVDVLRINTEDVDIYIKESPDDRIRVEVFGAGPDHDRVVAYFEEHLDLQVEQSGRSVVLKTNQPMRGDRWYWKDFWRRYRNVRAWAIVSVPAATTAMIDMDDGDLRIDNLKGEATVRTSDGDIEIKLMRGERLRIQTADGDLQIGTLDGGDIDLQTEDGDIFCEHLKGERVSVSSEDGDIELARVDGGKIKLGTEDGDIEVRATGSKLTATCEDGDMSVELQSTMSVDLQSVDGDIDLTIPETMDADLDLRGDDVHVRGSIKVEGRMSSSRVVGSINRGGTALRARSEDGTIRISLR